MSYRQPLFSPDRGSPLPPENYFKHKEHKERKGRKEFLKLREPPPQLRISV